MTLTHTVAVKNKRLSDGSTVYDVEISEYGPADSSARMTFNAVDRNAAFRLADKVAALLNDTGLVLAEAETRDYTYA